MCYLKKGFEIFRRSILRNVSTFILYTYIVSQRIQSSMKRYVKFSERDKIKSHIGENIEKNEEASSTSKYYGKRAVFLKCHFIN